MARVFQDHGVMGEFPVGVGVPNGRSAKPVEETKRPSGSAGSHAFIESFRRPSRPDELNRQAFASFVSWPWLTVAQLDYRLRQQCDRRTP